MPAMRSIMWGIFVSFYGICGYTIPTIAFIGQTPIAGPGGTF